MGFCMSRINALLVAFFGTPPITALLFVVYFGLQMHSNAQSMVMLYPFICLICGLVEVFFGIPLLCVGFYLNAVKWWSAFLGGAIAGTGAILAFRLLAGAAKFPQTHEVFPYSAIGAIGGFAFWLISTLAPATWRKV